MLRASLLSVCAAIALVSCTDLPDVDDPRDFALEDLPVSCADLLDDGNFDRGGAAWEVNASDIITDDTELPPETVIQAHSGSHFAWLGGVPSATRKLSQRVDTVPGARALKLKGKYFVATESVTRVEDTLVIEIVDAATSRILATPMSLSNVNPTHPGNSSAFSWVDLSLEISVDNSTPAFVLRFTSVNDAVNNTNFMFDSMTLKPSSCF